MIEKIKKVVSEVFSIDNVPNDLGINRIKEWDSLGQIRLILAIEQEFGLKVPTEKIIELSSIEKIAAYLGEEVKT